MKKYAKIVNEQTKEVNIGTGTNIEFYKAIGMEEMDVEEAFDGNWYVEGYAPKKPEPTIEEIKQKRKEYRRLYVDDSTAERSRKMANGSWTQEDEEAYLALDSRITLEIETLYPYPVE